MEINVELFVVYHNDIIVYNASSFIDAINYIKKHIGYNGDGYTRIKKIVCTVEDEEEVCPDS